MMTLEPISIRTDFSQVVPQRHERFAAIIEPVAGQDDRPPTLEKFLCRMTQADLFGQEHLRPYFANLSRRRLSPNTIRSYQVTLFGFISFLKSKGRHFIETIVREDVEAYVEHEQDRGMRPSTVHARIRAVYAFIQFLVDHDTVNPNTLKRRIKIKLSDTLPRAIDPEDIRTLLAVISDPRDRAMILILLRTGMRIGELLNTRLADINLAERRIDIFEAQKNRVGRVVYISNDALAAIKRWLKVKKSISDFLFAGHRGRPPSYEAARLMFIRYLTKAGLVHKGYTLHALRHTCASELLNAGMRLECLQQMLGHANIEMTRRYARLTDTTRKTEYFKAMETIEKEGIGGHYRRDHSIQTIY
ncbi:tyrosine-type recombinase/integrase [uncultured Desulfosarcina sp.]|uniref:tyrosine-type recombinase/integrase n=1 Tax=uncultured Desulfosarcina sp. TaxID=218289 RepID=UPI0029C71528|nr:tyrosine-type recombinase/integrase [uncultured Desulfosarcina sp.]